jgi:hypothetical protein
LQAPVKPSSMKEQGMKEQLIAVLQPAYEQARAIMQAHRGKWTANGRSVNMAFRALEVACRKLGIPTPPLAERPQSVIRYEYNAQDAPQQDDTPGEKDIIATSENTPKRKSRRNDAI